MKLSEKKEIHVKKIKPRMKSTTTVDSAAGSRAGKKCAPIDGN